VKRERLDNGGVVPWAGFDTEVRGKMKIYVKMQEDRISSVVASPAPTSGGSCSYKTSISSVKIRIW